MEENKIRKAVIEYTLSDKIGYIQDPTDLDVEDSFVEGAKWALSHQWISVNNELPDYGVSVIVHNGISAGISNRTHNDFAKDSNDFLLLTTSDTIKFWMTIPSL